MFFFLYQFIAQVEEINDEETELLTGELKKKTQKNRNLVNQSPPFTVLTTTQKKKTLAREQQEKQSNKHQQKKVIKTVEENNIKEKESKIANHAP